MAHFALSNILWIQEQRVRARFHLEQAYSLGNNFVVIVNNLAWILANDENPDLERALELARTAVDRAPDNPRFRDTLGTVLMKQSQYEKAISEFQRAINGIPNRSKVHSKLAFCYLALGMTDLAELHRAKSIIEIPK